MYVRMYVCTYVRMYVSMYVYWKKAYTVEYVCMYLSMAICARAEHTRRSIKNMLYYGMSRTTKLFSIIHCITYIFSIHNALYIFQHSFMQLGANTAHTSPIPWTSRPILAQAIPLNHDDWAKIHAHKIKLQNNKMTI